MLDEKRTDYFGWTHETKVYKLGEGDEEKYYYADYCDIQAMGVSIVETMLFESNSDFEMGEELWIDRGINTVQNDEILISYLSKRD